jgi:protocatechuate 3,4-dioxygenase beta subunit
LTVGFTVSRVADGACAPLPGAVVDVWYCDDTGRYSDVRDSAVGFDTSGQQFLRGQQVTAVQGRAGFVTVYPGWYPGRTVHIHFKVRAAAGGAGASTAEFTSQLFFDDSLTDRVYSLAPYSTRGARTVRNAGDGIYRQGGEQLVLDLVEAGQGYAGNFALGLALG